MSNPYVLKELVVNEHSVLPENSGWITISHNPITKVYDGAEIWPRQAYMPSENLLICRVVCPTFAMKRSGGVGIWQLSEEALRHILQLSLYVRTP
jgi:hypothetical protein